MDFRQGKPRPYEDLAETTKEGWMKLKKSS